MSLSHSANSIFPSFSLLLLFSLSINRHSSAWSQSTARAAFLIISKGWSFCLPRAWMCWLELQKDVDVGELAQLCCFTQETYLQAPCAGTGGPVWLLWGHYTGNSISFRLCLLILCRKGLATKTKVIDPTCGSQELKTLKAFLSLEWWSFL